MTQYMPYKDPEAKKAWRRATADRQKVHRDGHRERERTARTQEILGLPDSQRASEYLRSAGFSNIAVSVVAEWARKCPATIERANEIQSSASRKSNLKLRLAAIEMLGGRCECCGLDVIEILEFDHKEPVKRRTNGIRNRDAQSSARDIVRKGNAYLYQLLCPNCHALKTKMNGEHSTYGPALWDEALSGAWDGWGDGGD